MSQEDEALVKKSTNRRAESLEECLDYALKGAVAYSGGIMTGLSMRMGDSDYLLTLRADFPAGPMVTWVGGTNIVEIFLKAVRETNDGKLSWRIDKYRQT